MLRHSFPSISVLATSNTLKDKVIDPHVLPLRHNSVMNARSHRTPRIAQASTERQATVNRGTTSSPSGTTPPRLKSQSAKTLTLNPKQPTVGRLPKGTGKAADKRKAQPDTPAPEPELAKSITINGAEFPLLDFGLHGDILIDVSFSNDHCRRSILNLGTGQAPRFSNSAASSTPITNEHVIYRVHLSTLTKNSKYFERLLTDTRFSEAKKINATFAELKAKNIKVEDAQPSELPRISITEDTDATLISNRSGVFSDLLRILHGQDITSKLSMPYLAILAVMADCFDCASVVGRYARGSRRIPWPQTTGVQTFSTEEGTRMKVLVSWYLEDAAKFAASTKELVMRGSLRWAGREEQDMVGVWWDLPDGLEAELHLRRACILRTISSLQTHFISLYTSKQRQCKMFYDSSVACDSFQLGEMIRFFVNKNMFTFLSPISPPTDDDFDELTGYDGDIEALIKDLRQCPSWQYDQNHAHCGLRTRLIPALDYVQAMLNQGVGIDWKWWKRDQVAASWDIGEQERTPFVLIKGVDSRLNFQEILATPISKACFTASSWDWTGETNGENGDGRLGTRFGKATWKIPD